MFNLEKSIQTWKRNLRSSPAFEDGDIAELESHLRDEIERLKANGLSEEEAFETASEEIGEPEPIGDELYKSRATQKAGPVPPWRHKSWIPSLLPNYLKVAYRQLIRFKTYSVINIGGLAVGIACFLIISLYVRDELSFDRYHSNSEQIYRLVQIVDEVMTHTSETIKHAGMSEVPPAIIPLLDDQIPEIENTTRLRSVYGTQVVASGEKALNQNNIYYAEPSLFKIFDIPVISGDPEAGLGRPGTVFISESAAIEYFGAENPLGSMLKIDNEREVEITGVFRDLPENSHLSFDFLYSYETLSEDSKNSWREYHIAYIQVKTGADISRLESRLADLPGTLENESGESSLMPATESLALMPLHDIHLYSQNYLVGAMEGQGDIRYIYLFSAVAFVILLIAGINYINITTARASQRGREVGVRKAVGAVRNQLIFQFIGESVLVMVFAAMCGILLAELALPAVNGFVGRTMEFSFASDGIFWGILLAIILAVGLISGAYSAFVLSRFNPVRVIKGELGVASWNVTRKVLVVFQFGISTVLVIATLVMFYQLQFLQNRNLGFNKQQLLSISTQKALGNQAEAFKNEVLNNSGISSVTLTRGIPGDMHGSFVVYPDQIENFTGENDFIVLNYFEVDGDFQQTFEIEMAAGRMLSSEFGADVSEAVIINEAAARLFGWQNDAVGRSIQLRGDRRVIGVIKDFHFETLKSNIQPLVMIYGTSTPDHITVRLDTEDISGTLGQISATWKEFAPGYPFTYSFVDQTFDSMYRAERNLGKLFGIFTFLAVCIASLGLFGLASYTTQKRMKEIGIRKILGAGFRHIISVLSRDFIVLLAISFAIAVPITWYFMNQWLANFAYRINIGPELFLVAAAISVLIIAMSIGWHAVRAISLNPVTIIKKE